MATKDSFTFSDKLKKSKSLPLSKRIPSRSGGDGKAKRTLIQRAQRDLPFIIVAALALLLLPLLSRNTGADYVTGWDNPGYDEFVGDGDHGLGYISGDGDLMPASGYRNPLDMIVTKKGEDSPAPVADDYSDEDISDMTGSPDNSFDREETSKPVTSAYRTNARRAVRNAVQRKETAKGDLRNRAMSFGGNSSGLTRNLAIGGAPVKAASLGTPRAGVRPVALQPLKSYGVGRTSDGLYAEVARSLGAMNQGPAKQALYEAQLRDVDGTPLGAATDPRAAAARLASQGSVPDHKFGYTNQKPWWWDMMADRSQKLWELWNYNWQKALSDSLIKIATNLGMCLITGSEDGSVKNFLGIRGGSPDMECKDSKGNTLGMSWVDFSETFKGNSKDGNNSVDAGAYDYWVKQCKEMGGKVEGSSSGNKNAFEARMRCLGVDGGLSGLSKTNYSSNCDGVNQKDLVYTASANAKKGGKERKRKENNLGIYVLAQAKVKASIENKATPSGREYAMDTVEKDAHGNTKVTGMPFVIMFNQNEGNTLRLSESQMEAISKYCQISTVGSFKAKRKISSDLASRINDAYSFCTNVGGTAPSNPVYRSELFGAFNRWDDDANGKNGETGKPKNKKDVQSADIGASECVVKNFDTEFSGLGGDNNGRAFTCDNNAIAKNLVAAPTEFSATIKGVGKDSVYAVVVEDGVQGDKEGVFLRTIAAVNAEYNKSLIDQSGSKYTLKSMQIGKNAVNGNTATAGNGRVYWIVSSSKKAQEKKAANTFVPGAYHDHTSVSDFLDIRGAYVLETCDYSWGCNAENCPVGGVPEEPFRHEELMSDGKLCYVQNGDSYKFYTSLHITEGGKDVYVRNTNTPATREDLKTLLFDGEDVCETCIPAKIQAKGLKPCTPICKKKAEALGLDAFDMHEQDDNGKGKDAILVPWNAITSDPDGLQKVGSDDSLCPYCNPTKEEVEAKCNFASRVNFKNAQFDPGCDDNAQKCNKNERVNKYSSMVRSFIGCIHTLAGSHKAQTLYVTGFTNYAGENNKDRCPNGRCNQALSEDRAIYSAHYLLNTLNDQIGVGALDPNAITVDVKPSRSGDIIGFNNTNLPKGVVKNHRYTGNAKPAGNGGLKITLVAQGCGAEGATPGDKNTKYNTEPYASERVMYFTTEDHSCDRSAYKSATAQ